MSDPQARAVRKNESIAPSWEAAELDRKAPMSVCHPGPALRAGSLNAAVNALRSRGLRVSAARRLVLEALYAADEPVTAEALAGGLGGRLPACDLASVYRNLETLESVGLVAHVHVGHAAGRYALAGSGRDGWAACEACGRHVALAPAAIERVRAAVREACGFEARFSHFPVVGRCPECAA